MNEFIELEEHYGNGICIKRLLNGVEVSADTFASVMQHAPRITTKTIMTLEEAKQRYGHYPSLRKLLSETREK